MDHETRTALADLNVKVEELTKDVKHLSLKTTAADRLQSIELMMVTILTGFLVLITCVPLLK